MDVSRDSKDGEIALRGKYHNLYTHLRGLLKQEWRVSFGEVEAIIGFELPPSARLHRPWWANQLNGSSHTHALAWSAAGWETAEVDMRAERLLFRRKGKFCLNEVWPPISVGTWPKGLSLRREDMYGDGV